mmetsp:Transcript_4336/g.6319  ORF Transcript_4336/g.6319 Transcript_4336/m.6319 type:complete len:322 (+) Transcript_4336:95-1060(+)
MPTSCWASSLNLRTKKSRWLTTNSRRSSILTSYPTWTVIHKKKRLRKSSSGSALLTTSSRAKHPSPSMTASGKSTKTTAHPASLVPISLLADSKARRDQNTTMDTTHSPPTDREMRRGSNELAARETPVETTTETSRLKMISSGTTPTPSRRSSSGERRQRNTSELGRASISKSRISNTGQVASSRRPRKPTRSTRTRGNTPEASTPTNTATLRKKPSGEADTETSKKTSKKKAATSEREGSASARGSTGTSQLPTPTTKSTTTSLRPSTSSSTSMPSRRRKRSSTRSTSPRKTPTSTKPTAAPTLLPSGSKRLGSPGSGG